MAHLFNKPDYYDYRSKVYTNVKKSLENKVDFLTETSHIQPHPIDLHQEQVKDSINLHFTYQGQTFTLPNSILQVPNLEDIINLQVITQEFDEQQMAQLLQLLPTKSMDSLQYALTGKGFIEKPLKTFEKKLKNGHFTTFHQKEEEITATLSEYRMRQIYQNLLKTIVSHRNSTIKKQKVHIQQDISSVQSMNDLSSIQDMSQNSQATQTQQELDQLIDDQYQKVVFFKYDYSKIKCQEELLALGEQKNDKKATMYKVTMPIKPKNSEWVDNYRRQQFQRYSNPTKPWGYTCEDGRKVTVAPVAKKLSVLSGKPRDHPLLKSQRPACVTILTLVRDAAARLPNGYGTRADISELLKESQYVNEDLPQQKLSNIVSGALDRLHYMTDACVKYDSEKKLWIYLHSDRNYEHPGWGEDGQDYLDKYPSKKKKRDFE